ITVAPLPVRRVDRSFQTDAQAKPARPGSGTASGASRRLRENDAPDPRRVLARTAAQVEPILRLRTVAGDDPLQLVPVGLGVLPDTVVVLAQLRVRNREAQLPDLRHVPV